MLGQRATAIEPRATEGGRDARRAARRAALRCPPDCRGNQSNQYRIVDQVQTQTLEALESGLPPQHLFRAPTPEEVARYAVF